MLEKKTDENIWIETRGSNRKTGWRGLHEK
jgi:hypothetical protein